MAACLAVETSSRIPSVYWKDGPNNISLMPEKEALTSDLVSKLHEQVNAKKINLDDLDTILVSEGPGNYTGLRVGLSMVQALALTRNVQIYTFNSLDVIAETWRISNSSIDEIMVFVEY